MNQRSRLLAVVGTIAVMLVAPVAALGQSAQPARTSWGDPNLQGNLDELDLHTSRASRLVLSS